MNRTRLLLPIVLLALLAPNLAAQARVRASQHGTVSQTVNKTVITVEYDRPIARGRDLFGGLVRWDEEWTPGANGTTWIDVSTALTLEGQSLDAGRYGVRLTPHEGAGWDVTLVTEWDTDHGAYPGESEVFRSAIRPKEGAHMEALSFYFPTVEPYETTIRFHWGTTIVPLRIEVPQG